MMFNPNWTPKGSRPEDYQKTIKEEEWKYYNDIRPQKEGIYEWRIPSVAVPGVVIISTAWMRSRGAGLESIISPMFDHWDGWKVLVPPGLQWRESQEGYTLRKYDHGPIEIEGLTNLPCPFCSAIPEWEAVWNNGGGVVISSELHRYNSFWLSCCSWAKTPHTKDPRKLTQNRNDRLKRAGVI